jgi:hypothetical protein
MEHYLEYIKSSVKAKWNKFVKFLSFPTWYIALSMLWGAVSAVTFGHWSGWAWVMFSFVVLSYKHLNK